MHLHYYLLGSAILMAPPLFGKGSTPGKSAVMRTTGFYDQIHSGQTHAIEVPRLASNSPTFRIKIIESLSI